MRKLFIAAFAALSSLVLTSIALPAMAASMGKPLPIDHFAIRDSINTVALSPDGKHVLVMKTVSKDGKYIIEIYKSDDFSKPLRRIGADPMEFFVGPAPRWVSDTVIVGSAWKWVRKNVRGPEDTAWDSLLFSYDIEKDKFKTLEDKRSRDEGNGFSIVSVLPGKDDEILIVEGNDVGAGLGVDPFQRFRPRSYYYYNVKRGTKRLLYKGNDEYANIIFDGKGNPRFAQGVRDGELANFYRLPGDKNWKEFWTRENGNDWDQMYRILGGVEGYASRVKDKPELIWMFAMNGEDKVGLWEYNIVEDKFVRKIYGREDADILNLQFHSNSWGAGEDDVAVSAAIYSGAKRERHWFDPEEQALHEQLEAGIPNSHQVNITSRSRDGQTMIVRNVGPKDPGSFWLVKDGKMGKLGSRNVLVSADDLNEVKFIKYPARDGMMIPGYVTIPKGEGPHPLVVLPHGGPHVNEVITYDEWGQFLANNGYMVLQPQYRMSVGWGKKHFESAMGQHGLAMQDDKDDGALYLVEQGMVDPDRMAMFGWSYGGYAALVAAVREPQIYQCVIAGAAVADPRKSYLKRSRGASGRLKDDMITEWAKARGGYVGINPIDEIEKLNVPFMMVHPKQDARVQYFHYKDFQTEVEKFASTKTSWNCSGGNEDGECVMTLQPITGTRKKSDTSVVSMPMESSVGKSYKTKSRFVTLEQADHFSVTLMYEHQKKLYTEMLDFLETDCGPGGL